MKAVSYQVLCGMLPYIRRIIPAGGVSITSLLSILDYLMYAAPDLDAAIEQVEQLLEFEQQLVVSIQAGEQKTRYSL